MTVHNRYNASTSSLHALDLGGLDRGFCKRDITTIGGLDLATQRSDQFVRANGLITTTFASQEFKRLGDLRENTLALHTVPNPVFTNVPLKRYRKNCQTLINKIKPTVDRLLDSMDYNPLNSYVQTIDQMEKGVAYRDVMLTSEGEEDGSICSGMSKAIVDTVKKEHRGIEGRTAEKHENHEFFTHAAAMFLCTDGCVIIEPSLPASKRYFAIPFNGGYQGLGFSFEASQLPNGNVKITCHGTPSYESPARSFTYHSNITNGNNAVTKSYIAHARDIPITAYQSEQNFPHKVIMIHFNEKTIDLEDRSNSQLLNDPLQKGKRIFPKTRVSFDEVLDGDFRAKLKRFAGRDYKTKIPVLHQQIQKVVSRRHLLTKIFHETKRK